MQSSLTYTIYNTAGNLPIRADLIISSQYATLNIFSVYINDEPCKKLINALYTNTSASVELGRESYDDILGIAIEPSMIIFRVNLEVVWNTSSVTFREQLREMLEKLVI